MPNFFPDYEPDTEDRFILKAMDSSKEHEKSTDGSTKSPHSTPLSYTVIKEHAEVLIEMLAVLKKDLKRYLSISLERRKVTHSDYYNSDEEYKLVWDIYSEFLFQGPSSEHLSDPCLKQISNCIYANVETIKEIVASCYDEVCPFEQTRAGIDVLKEYLEIGKTFANDRLTREFIHEKLANVIKKAASSERPFGFICASSGEGKTNFALATIGPYLFFVYGHSSQTMGQGIYDPFSHQSSELFQCLKQDLQNYKRFLRQQKDFDPRDYKKAVAYDSLNENRHKIAFRTVGFLASMVKHMNEMHQKTPDKSSAESQVLMLNVKFRSMTTSEARIHLFSACNQVDNPDDPTGTVQNIDSESFADISRKEAEKVVFPIFFDECNLESAQPGSNGELEFMMLRSLVRLMGCTPIFMGTNAKATNFLAAMYDESQSGATQNKVWSVVLFRLPRVNESWLFELQEEVKLKVGEWRKGRPFPSDSLIEFVFDLIHREKPLFVIAARDFFNRLTKDRNDGLTGPEYILKKLGIKKTESEFLESDERIFSVLCAFILRHYQSRKAFHSNYNLGQLFYIVSYAWEGSDIILKQKRKAGSVGQPALDSEVAIPKECKDNDSDDVYAESVPEIKLQLSHVLSGMKQPGVKIDSELLSSGYFIHSHMAALNARSDSDFPGAASICIDKKETIRNTCYYLPGEQLENNAGPIFKIGSRYSNFSRLPATGLICEGVISDYSKPLVATTKDNKIVRISVVDAISRFNKTDKNLGNLKDQLGLSLEVALTCAMVLASRAQGFHGCPLPVFLRNLIRELDLGASYASNLDQVYNIDIPTEFPSDLQIPFCSPMATDSWNPRLVEQLHSLFFDKDQVAIEALRFGIVFPSVFYERVDCALVSVAYKVSEKEDGKLERYTELESCLVVGECKMYSKPLEGSDLKKIVKKFESTSVGKFFIIACISMKDIKIALNGVGDEVPVPDGLEVGRDNNVGMAVSVSPTGVGDTTSDVNPGRTYCFWRLVRKHVGPGFTAERLNDLQSYDAERHVLVLELEKLYTGADSDWNDRCVKFMSA